MPDKRMLIVDADVISRVDQNRGDMNHSDFINFLIDSCLKEEPVKNNYITKKEFDEFQQGTRELMRNFLEFFISYGLEMGAQPQDKTFEELSQKLQDLEASGNKVKNL